MDKISALAFHCHHEQLVEYVYDYQERVDDIKSSKPRNEQELRLRLFRMIPDDRLPGRDSPEWAAYDKTRAAYAKARAAYAKARAAHDKTWAAYAKAWAASDKTWAASDKTWAAYAKAWAAYDKARAAHDKTRAAYAKAWAAYALKFTAEFAVLHAELCPDCPWNGKTIFP